MLQLPVCSVKGVEDVDFSRHVNGELREPLTIIQSSLRCNDTYPHTAIDSRVTPLSLSHATSSCTKRFLDTTMTALGDKREHNSRTGNGDIRKKPVAFEAL